MICMRCGMDRVHAEVTVSKSGDVRCQDWQACCTIAELRESLSTELRKSRELRKALDSANSDLALLSRHIRELKKLAEVA